MSDANMVIPAENLATVLFEIRQDLAQKFGGLLTAYFSEGLDIIQFQRENVLDQIAKLADKIGEPVQLVINFDDIGNTFFLRLPNRESAKTTSSWILLKDIPSPEQGGWSNAFSSSSRQFVEREKVDFHLLFSGAPFREPTYLVDLENNPDRTKTEITKRVQSLHATTGFEICARCAGEVLTTSQRPSERHVTQLQEVLTKFYG